MNHLSGDAEVPPYCGLLRSPGLEVLIVGVDWGCNFDVPSAGRQVVTKSLLFVSRAYLLKLDIISIQTVLFIGKCLETPLGPTCSTRSVRWPVRQRCGTL